MSEINIDDIVEKFKTRLLATKEAEKFRKETVEPLVEKVFETEFVQSISNIAMKINHQVGTEVIRYYSESRNKFIIEGLYHRVYFQKSNIDIIENSAYINIIPIYIWKGATKHLGPISLIVNTKTHETSWDISSGSIEAYASKLFAGFTEDKDFSI